MSIAERHGGFQEMDDGVSIAVEVWLLIEIRPDIVDGCLEHVEPIVEDAELRTFHQNLVVAEAGSLCQAPCFVGALAVGWPAVPSRPAGAHIRRKPCPTPGTSLQLDIRHGDETTGPSWVSQRSPRVAPARDPLLGLRHDRTRPMHGALSRSPVSEAADRSNMSQ